MRAGLFVVGLFVTLAASACGDGSSGAITPAPSATDAASPLPPTSPPGSPSPAAPPSATTTAQPSPVTTSCPVVAELCDFASRTARKLVERDIEGVIDDSPGQAVTCTTGVNPGLGADFPLCNGATPGEVRFGFEFGRFQSEGSTVARAGLEYQLGEWLGHVDASLSDGLGGGAVRPFTIGCPEAGSSIDCSIGVSVVFSAILRGDTREFLMLTFTPLDGGGWGVAGMYTGIAKLNMGYLTGGQVGGLSPGDPASPRVRYMPIGA